MYQLMFGVPYLLAYTSRFTALLPGGVVATGAPAGTSYRRSLPIFLQPGNVVKASIDGLGQQRGARTASGS